MKFAYDLTGADPIVRDYPVFGNSANINLGAVVIRGATAGTNQPFAILGASPLTDVLGVMIEPHTSAAAADDSNTTGTRFIERKIIINPFAVYRVEYDLTDTAAVASTSGTTVTITSLENDIDGGYLYAPGGTGIGRLAFIVTSAAGSCTTKETTGWGDNTTVIKILPLWHQLVLFNSTFDKLGTNAAAGASEVTVLQNYIEADGIGLVRLSPVIHSGLTGLDLRNVKFYADIIFRNHALNTID